MKWNPSFSILSQSNNKVCDLGHSTSSFSLRAVSHQHAMAEPSRSDPDQLTRSSKPATQEPVSGADLSELRLSKAQLLQKIQQLSAQKQIDLFSAWVGRLEPAQFKKISAFIRLENDLRQELGGEVLRRNALTEVFLKGISHRRRNSSEITPPQLYVYIRRRRKSSESGTKYLGKLFFVPGGHTYKWKEGTNGALVFYEGNVFCLTHLRTKELRYLKLVRLDQPPPDYDYNPQPGEKPLIQVSLYVEVLHPQTLQPVEMKIYDYPSCLYEKGELSEALWQVEALNAALAMKAAVVPEVNPLGQGIEQTGGKTTRMVVDRSQALKILPLLRQFRDFSQKVYSARSLWYLSEPEGGGKYALTTAGGKLILEFDTKRWEFSTEHSAQVLARWFYNLCTKVQAGFDVGDYGDFSLSDRQLISELLVQLQTVKGKSVEEILRLIFQVDVKK